MFLSDCRIDGSYGQKKREKPTELAISGKRTKTHPSCPICYREITSTIKSVVLPCFHVFCYSCIIHWIKVKAICPICHDKLWAILYSIRSEDDYKLVKVRERSLQCMHLECDVYTPHLFLNQNGEYECTIIETNRLREMLGLPPLEL